MKKILVIEDDRDILTNLESLLSLNGYQVYLAFDGAEGLKAAREYSPDLILCDIMMPVCDGYTLKKNLEADKKTSAIPFVFLTAKANLEDMRAGMNLGADDYLIKPFKAADLLQAVEARFKRIKQFREKKQDAKKPLKNDERIFIDLKDKQMFLKISDIKYITAETVYTRVFTSDNKSFLLRKLLKDWESSLPKDKFLRVHRSCMINLDYISKVEKWFKRTYKVYLTGVENPIDISQRYAIKLKAQLSR
ncbi:MAG: LytR/AlgR family response regulator transcription factor [Bacteroidota bacterium]